jgi:hypothetical protein
MTNTLRIEIFVLRVWSEATTIEGTYRPDPIKNIRITTREEMKKNSRIFPVFLLVKRVRMLWNKFIRSSLGSHTLLSKENAKSSSPGMFERRGMTDLSLVSGDTTGFPCLQSRDSNSGKRWKDRASGVTFLHTDETFTGEGSGLFGLLPKSLERT